MNFLLWILLIAYSPSINKEHAIVREYFEKSVNCEKDATNFHKQFEKIQNLPPDVHSAYKGMTYLIISRHSGTWIEKYDNFIVGKSYLENAIKTSPNNVEFRFLRHSVQSNTPVFLLYQDEIEADQKIIEQFIAVSSNKTKDTWLFNSIKKYLKIT